MKLRGFLLLGGWRGYDSQECVEAGQGDEVVITRGLEALEGMAKAVSHHTGVELVTEAKVLRR